MASTRVLGIVPNRPAAEQVVGNLRMAGFTQDDVSFIMVEPEADSNLDAKAADQSGRGVRKVLLGLVRGMAIALVIGLAAGFGVYQIESINSVLPLGVILGLFGSASLIVGALAGAFSTEKPSNQVIERYGMELREGQAIVAVDSPDADVAKKAEEILNTGGAIKVNSFLVEGEDLAESLEQELGAEVDEVTPQEAHM